MFRGNSIVQRWHSAGFLRKIRILPNAPRCNLRKYAHSSVPESLVARNDSLAMLSHLKISILALGLLAAPPAFAAQNADTAPAAVAVTNHCIYAAGTLQNPTVQPTFIDGTQLENVKAIRSLRAKAKDGRTLIIQGGNFSGMKFDDDNFSNICFIGTKLLNTRWVKTRAQGIGFIDADLTGSTFDRVQMPYVLFRNTVLANVDATGTQLSYGQLDGGWDPSIANLKLDNATMIGFRFVCGTTAADGCPFDRKQISLRGANLSGALLSTFSIWDARVDDAILANTEIAFDQLTQFVLADIRGPVIVRAQQKSIALAPDAFRVTATALRDSAAVTNTECNNPPEPLAQLLCQAGRGNLRASRDDIERLYAAERPVATATAVPVSQITVTAASKEHDKYLKTLRRCALKDEEKAFPCIAVAMEKRRAVLVGRLVSTRPLEPGARALYVSTKAPLAQMVANDSRLAALSPLLVDGSVPVLMAYFDDDQALQARGVVPHSDGAQCVASFASLPKTAKKTKGKKQKKKQAQAPAPTFLTWMTGAEFTVGTAVKPKKVKPKKSKKRNASAELASADPVAPTGCNSAALSSGPLVRLPISENEFDRLWVNAVQREPMLVPAR
jgi:uncharacterized protein YjbI with pentapeptide repeats